MDKDVQMTKEQYLQEELSKLRGILDRSNATTSVLSQELVFWKKLALSNLGVDSQKINELVNMNVYSGSGIGGALTRGY